LFDYVENDPDYARLAALLKFKVSEFSSVPLATDAAS
jgi:hypothetical protein